MMGYGCGTRMGWLLCDGDEDGSMAVCMIPWDLLGNGLSTALLDRMVYISSRATASFSAILSAFPSTTSTAHAPPGPHCPSRELRQHLLFVLAKLRYRHLLKNNRRLKHLPRLQPAYPKSQPRSHSRKSYSVPAYRPPLMAAGRTAPRPIVECL